MPRTNAKRATKIPHPGQQPRPDERDRRALLFPTRNESALAPTVVQIREDFIGAVMPTKPAGDAEAYQPPGLLDAASTEGAWC